MKPRLLLVKGLVSKTRLLLQFMRLKYNSTKQKLVSTSSNIIIDFIILYNCCVLAR